MLKLSVLGKNFSGRHFEIFFFYFSEKIGFSYLLQNCLKKTIHKKSQSLFSKTICMKCKILFSPENKETYNHFVVC